MNPTETVEAYYEALRRGEPLFPYFVEREDVVKFGVSERLAGYETIADGLREQTRTTEDWRVESQRLQTVVREPVAWFTDDVALSWLDSEGVRQSFDTRWSGVLEQEARDAGHARNADERATGVRDTGTRDTGDDEPRWRFAQMHVSAPHEF